MGNHSDIIAESSESLAKALGAALKARGLKLALAESCTGGMMAAAITSVAGSSAWFDRGFVTYSNEAKIEMLGVLPETLEKHGAVSEETAIEMAQGCVSRSQSQLAGSITGIAGPDGGGVDKPVGTVCFAWVIQTSSTATSPVSVATQLFTGNRQQIRQQATVYLMQQLILVIN
jgi:nicotinamide-nucleotide amidase